MCDWHKGGPLSGASPIFFMGEAEGDPMSLEVPHIETRVADGPFTTWRAGLPPGAGMVQAMLTFMKTPPALDCSSDEGG